MIINYNGKIYAGTPYEIFDELRAYAFSKKTLSVEEYIEFTCDNYYKMQGIRPELKSVDTIEKCRELIGILSEVSVIHILKA